MFYHFNTLCADKNIGKYYNECCSIVPNPSDWIGIWDADLLGFFTVNNWGAFLEEAIVKYPDVKLFTCVANRIGTHKQRVHPQGINNPSMKYHRNVCQQLFDEKGMRIRTDAKTVSGMMLLFQKSTWLAVNKFDEGGMLHIDREFSRRVSTNVGKIGILEGMYVMHYYRLSEGHHNHLK
jgi:GT2 family glycosyltransferase